ncbi:hypothetical protein NA57DRAFT_54429 [Rhizodiscina lignyota]|uniref:SCA7 domain-containing protein n=1 Tax=Rhizodiscina lignyota TaxID=1504668 RepID=A0A9P4ILI3_9PEZI|nr:hypothetical protein NA57DRAFT_54429 [Rhizodiscina lignyota]
MVDSKSDPPDRRASKSQIPKRSIPHHLSITAAKSKRFVQSARGRLQNQRASDSEISPQVPNRPSQVDLMRPSSDNVSRIPKAANLHKPLPSRPVLQYQRQSIHTEGRTLLDAIDHRAAGLAFPTLLPSGPSGPPPDRPLPPLPNNPAHSTEAPTKVEKDKGPKSSSRASDRVPKPSMFLSTLPMIPQPTKVSSSKHTLVDNNSKAKEVSSQKAKEVSDPKAKAREVKGSVNVEEQCGVQFTNGGRCTRNLLCQIHTKEAKRAVPGRSVSFDILLARYLARNAHEDFRSTMARSDTSSDGGSSWLEAERSRATINYDSTEPRSNVETNIRPPAISAERSRLPRRMFRTRRRLPAGEQGSPSEKKNLGNSRAVMTNATRHEEAPKDPSHAEGSTTAEQSATPSLPNSPHGSSENLAADYQDEIRDDLSLMLEENPAAGQDTENHTGQAQNVVIQAQSNAVVPEHAPEPVLPPLRPPPTYPFARKEKVHRPPPIGFPKLVSSPLSNCINPNDLPSPPRSFSRVAPGSASFVASEDVPSVESGEETLPLPKQMRPFTTDGSPEPVQRNAVEPKDPPLRRLPRRPTLVTPTLDSELERQRSHRGIMGSIPMPPIARRALPLSPLPREKSVANFTARFERSNTERASAGEPDIAEGKAVIEAGGAKDVAVVEPGNAKDDSLVETSDVKDDSLVEPGKAKDSVVPEPNISTDKAITETGNGKETEVAELGGVKDVEAAVERDWNSPRRPSVKDTEFSGPKLKVAAEADSFIFGEAGTHRANYDPISRGKSFVRRMSGNTSFPLARTSTFEEPTTTLDFLSIPGKIKNKEASSGNGVDRLESAQNLEPEPRLSLNSSNALDTKKAANNNESRENTTYKQPTVEDDAESINTMDHPSMASRASNHALNRANSVPAGRIQPTENTIRRGGSQRLDLTTLVLCQEDVISEHERRISRLEDGVAQVSAAMSTLNARVPENLEEQLARPHTTSTTAAVVGSVRRLLNRRSRIPVPSSPTPSQRRHTAVSVREDGLTAEARRLADAMAAVARGTTDQARREELMSVCWFACEAVRRSCEARAALESLNNTLEAMLSDPRINGV